MIKCLKNIGFREKIAGKMNSGPDLYIKNPSC